LQLNEEQHGHGSLSAPQQGTRAQAGALAPEISAAFKALSARVFADGALPAKTKQLIASRWRM
jgi:alkylhydroperoxidase/carboxymuconolactone decarboxylase family protein YurZ